MATTIDLLKNSAFESKMDLLIAAVGGGSAKIEAFSATNPALTQSSGTCTWTVRHNLGKSVFYNIIDASTKEDVMATVTNTDVNTLTIKIASTANVTAGKYKITVIGCEVSA